MQQGTGIDSTQDLCSRKPSSQTDAKLSRLMQFLRIECSTTLSILRVARKPVNIRIMHVRVSVHMYSNTCMYTCVWVYICTRVDAFLDICTVQSLYYMHVYHKCLFNACMRV